MTVYPWKWNLADLPEPAADAPTAFSCFSCGGGSTMGYKRAGFRVLGNVEIDPAMFAMYGGTTTRRTPTAWTFGSSTRWRATRPS